MQVELHTDAVVLVFHGNCAGGDLAQPLHRIGRTGSWCGEHRWDRMEVVKFRFGKSTALGEQRNSTGIPF